MKWLGSLIFLTSFFIISSFFIPEKLVLSYRWMTIGMSIVSFTYYFIIWKTNLHSSEKMVGANFAAIILKFILSALVIILYAFLFGLNNNIDFLFFFMAYLVYSLITYIGTYNYK